MKNLLVISALFFSINSFACSGDKSANASSKGSTCACEKEGKSCGCDKEKDGKTCGCNKDQKQKS